MSRARYRIHEAQRFVSQFFVGIIRGNDSALASTVRRKLYKTRCAIDTNVFVTNPGNFSSGQSSVLYHSCYILNNNGKFTLGDNSHLGAYCYVNVDHGNVSVGNHVAIGPGTKIIAYSNHYARGKKVTDERKVADISIGNNVFVGANCTLLPGTIIQDNVIVAAGAVVTGTLKTNAVYGGVPAKKIRSGWYA
jgi:acetyltransferase-like isoleucine patch superfamily enzyme